jgi:hypothetical protein
MLAPSTSWHWAISGDEDLAPTSVAIYSFHEPLKSEEGFRVKGELNPQSLES